MKKILVFLILLFSIGITNAQTTTGDGNNSLNSLLGADSVWTGHYTNLTVKNISSVSIFVYSDSASAANGLVILYSTDGVTEHDSTTYSIVADSSVSILLAPVTMYYKIKYKVGVKSANVIIQSILHTAAKGF